MKYVILQHPEKAPVVVLGMMVTHQDIAAPWLARGYRATSAGFVQSLPGGGFRTFGYSTSLQLTPDKYDDRLLTSMHDATVKTAPSTDFSAQPSTL
jgi:hypothetical protein